MACFLKIMVLPRQVFMMFPRFSTRTAIIRLWLALLAVALCGIGLRAPYVQAQDLAPAVAPECTVTVNATASCVDGHVVLTWRAQADALARVTVSYMGLNSGPYDLAPTFKVEGRLHTVVGSAPATVATFTSQYWSGSRWVNMTTQTKSLDAISCNTPTAVRLSTFTATSGTRFAFLDQIWHAFGITR
jgi:hypothetical protein